MGNERDLFEWRRYGHWDSSAAKARFAAYVLWRMCDHIRHAEFAYECGHNSGDTDLGLLEAFRRECALALELIVKAVIAKKLKDRNADPGKEGVPATHDLPKLWRQANLAKLSGDDEFRLQLAKSILTWAGRYPTPKNVKAWVEENKDFDALEDPPQDKSKFVIRTPVTMSWEDFDRLYQIAKASL
jgi:HEPN domain-containing protein